MAIKQAASIENAFSDIGKPRVSWQSTSSVYGENQYLIEPK